VNNKPSLIGVKALCDESSTVALPNIEALKYFFKSYEVWRVKPLSPPK
jgi:hypothetical protein